MSEQEMFNIKVTEKQEMHFMPMHIFHKPKLFHMEQRAKTNTLYYFLFVVIKFVFPMKI